MRHVAPVLLVVGSVVLCAQDPLGLELESDRGPVEFLVVDRIEQPTAD